VPTSAIAERFDQICRDSRGAIAIRDLGSGGAITFRDVHEQARAFCRAWRDAGIPRGACVVSSIGNRPAFFPLVVACMEMGAALLPLGDATDAEAAAIVRQAGATALITDRDVAFQASDDLEAPDGRRGDRQPSVVHRLPIAEGIQLVRLADPPGDPGYGEAVVLKLTSGSTDLPKAAIASERHLINDGRHIIEAMGLGADDVNFACIPASHSYGLGNLVMPLLWQGTGVALRQPFNSSQLMHDVATGGATVLPGVPFMFEHIRSLGPADRLPKSLRLLISAGARIDPQTVAWFHDCLGRKVHSFYGSSETGGISYDDSDGLQEPGHVGRPMPETTVAIEGANGGREGRIFIRSNAVALGYARTVGAPAPTGFRDGGFLSRDVGFLDDEGRVVLTGRASELVNVAGRKVDPAEVERTLLALPGIADARVLGAACARRGQQVVAFIVRSNAALTAIAIRQLCAGTLSTFKIPRRFIFLERLPIDARGKTDRRALEALAVTEESRLD
jgi:long-chain acyl-CoA synthetase